jgi:Domain of unknown function (DUF397)
MDVTGVAWRKSSYSGDNGGTCVEVGTTGPAIAVRDSDHPDGPQLAFPAATWQAFTTQLKSLRLIQSGSTLRLLTGLSLVKGSTPNPLFVFVDEVVAQSLDIAGCVLKFVPLALSMRAEIP